MQSWQIQDAKARLSEVVKRAEEEPQEITVHGEAKAVVLSKREYDRLSGRQQNLYEMLRSSPLVGLDIDSERDRDAPDRGTPLDWDDIFADQK